jgi:tight adherence protein B
MTGMMFPILIALAVATAVFGLLQIANSAMNEEKRKLKSRLSLSSNAETPINEAVRRPITFQTEVTGPSAMLIKWPGMESLYLKLLRAYPDMTLARFVGTAFGIAAVTFMMVGVIFDSVFVGLVAGGLGGYILSNKRASRQKQIANQLPEALDFLSRILRAGHSLSTGLQMMSDELPQPLAGEFRRCYDQHSLGQPLEDALKDMSTRIESTDFAFFITAILIQRQTGGDLSEVLNNISGMIRQRIRLQQHVKAKTAEGRFTGYILVGFPALMFVIAYAMSPEHMGVMLKTTTGLVMLGIAFGLQMGGLLAIRKITTVKV